MQNIIKEVDRLYEPYLRSLKTDPYSDVFVQFYKRCASITDCKILEIGSREVTTKSHKKFFPSASSYVGFDVHPGEGVDVVGDAHELSKYFSPGSFDAVFTIASFEHFAFPWKVAMEINKILRVGGLCHISTVNVWPPHELPWDFWRFPLAGLKMLFCDATGFAVQLAGEGLPARIHSLSEGPPTRGISDYEVSLGVAITAEKTKEYDRERLRWDVPLTDVTASLYPVHDEPLKVQKQDTGTLWDKVVLKIRRVFKK